MENYVKQSPLWSFQTIRFDSSKVTKDMNWRDRALSQDENHCGLIGVGIRIGVRIRQCDLRHYGHSIYGKKWQRVPFQMVHFFYSQVVQVVYSRFYYV